MPTDAKQQDLITRMAGAMFRIRGERGDCTRDDLLQEGFAARDIDRFSAEAKTRAARLHGAAA